MKKNSKLRSFLKKTFDKWKLYLEISEAGEIIRRYFVMNFFDGMLTALGIMLGFFLTVIDGQQILNIQIIKIALLTAVAIGISGVTGSRFAETTERKLKILEMREALCILDESEEDSNDNSTEKQDIIKAMGMFGKNNPRQINPNELRNAMGMFDSTQIHPIKIETELPKSTEVIPVPSQTVPHLSSTDIVSLKEKVIEKTKQMEETHERPATLFESAQRFASNIAALVDGLSPFFGVIIVVIPFLIPIDGQKATISQFIESFLITFTSLALLGSYLAKISKESRIKFALKMIGAAVLTTVISYALDMWI